MLLESIPPSSASSSDALLEQARVKLRPPRSRDRAWPAIAAATFFALAGLGFAAASILAPPLQTSPAAKIGVH